MTLTLLGLARVTVNDVSGVETTTVVGKVLHQVTGVMRSLDILSFLTSNVRNLESFVSAEELEGGERDCERDGERDGSDLIYCHGDNWYRY